MNGLDLKIASEISELIDLEDLVGLREYYRKYPDVFSSFAFSAAQNNAMHYAAANGKLKACECLISLGMDIDAETVRWKTPLCEAANRGHR